MLFIPGMRCDKVAYSCFAKRPESDYSIRAIMAFLLAVAVTNAIAIAKTAFLSRWAASRIIVNVRAR